MVFTNNISLPVEEELNVKEINLSTAYLRAGSLYFAKRCETVSNEFILCRRELNDPRSCLAEGSAVTSCVRGFFKSVKNSCKDEFLDFVKCIDRSSGGFQFRFCRKTQEVLDKCVKDKLGIEKYQNGELCRIRIHQSERPKPADPEKVEYNDYSPYLPEDYPRPPAKYGSRFIFLN